MSSHSVAEATERLPDLIAAAERGEPVFITRDGHPVAELRSLPSPRPLPARQAGIALAELSELRIRPAQRDALQSVDLIRQMRDEGP